MCSIGWPHLRLQAAAKVLLQLGELGLGLKNEGTRVRCGNLTDVKARVQPFADPIQDRERPHHEGECGREAERLVS